MATAADAGSPPTVTAYSYSRDAANVFRPPLVSFNAFDPAFRGGVHVATGDVTGDGVTDLVAAAGPGGGPHVKVFDGKALQQGQTVLAASFFAYDPTFRGGVYVAVGQIDPATPGLEIITGAGEGGGAHVRTFALASSSSGLAAVSQLAGLVGSFLAYDPAFRGGVRVASANLDAQSGDEIVTGAGLGGGPHIKAIRRDGSEFSSFMAFDSTSRGGVFVAAGEVIGARPRAVMPDGSAVAGQIVAGSGVGGNSEVRVFAVGQGTGMTHLMGQYSAAVAAAATGEVRVGLVGPGVLDRASRILTAGGIGSGGTVGFAEFTRPFVGEPETAVQVVSRAEFSVVDSWFAEAYPSEGVFVSV